MPHRLGARFDISEETGAVTIIIRPRKSLFLAAVLAVWLIVWFSGGWWMVAGLITSFSILMLLVTVLWFAGGLLAAKRLGWEFFGEQLISVREGRIVLEKRMLGRFKRKSFGLSEMSNLRLVSPEEESPEDNDNDLDEFIEPDDTFDDGLLECVVDKQVIYFATDIDEDEARYLLRKITAVIGRKGAE